MFHLQFFMHFRLLYVILSQMYWFRAPALEWLQLACASIWLPCCYQTAHYSECGMSVVLLVLSCTEMEQRFHKPRTLVCILQ